MFFLILAILCSSALSIVMRLSEGRVQSRTCMLAVNYVTCMLFSGLFTGFDLALDAPKSQLTLALGVINGFFYVAALLIMQWNIRKNGVILPSVFSRLGGLLVPLAVAICFFGEVPTPVQVIGAIIAGVSIIAINARTGQSSITSLESLMALLLLDGCASSMSTVYEQLGSSDLTSQFLFYTFATALVFCLLLILKSRERFGLQECLYGVAIGIPNFFASRALLQALESVPAVIAYPTRGVACIVVITLAGVSAFGERLKKHQWAAMAAILVAVVLLNI